VRSISRATCGASASVKPSRASRAAGSSTRVSGKRPKRRCSATRPAGSPGTPIDSGPVRSFAGSGFPSVRYSSGTAPAGAVSR
jgi:hypothetical protein